MLVEVGPAIVKIRREINVLISVSRLFFPVKMF